MPIFPVRDLGQKGILATPRRISFDLNAWSNGKGVRFHANKVQSGPIFRAAQDAQRRARILRRLTAPWGHDAGSMERTVTSAVATGDGRLIERVTATPVDAPRGGPTRFPHRACRRPLRHGFCRV